MSEDFGSSLGRIGRLGVVFPFVFEVSWLFHKDKQTEAMTEIHVRYVNIMDTALQERPVNQLKFIPEYRKYIGLWQHWTSFALSSLLLSEGLCLNRVLLTEILV